MNLEIFEKSLKGIITALPAGQVIEMIKVEFQNLELKDKLPMKLIDDLMQKKLYDRSYDTLNEYGDEYIGVWLGGECIYQVGSVTEFMEFIMESQDLSDQETDEREFDIETGLYEKCFSDHWIESYLTDKFYKKFAVHKNK